MKFNRFALASFLTFSLLLPTTGLAGGKVDWDRIDPVPDTQPVPVSDFFRPLLMRSATLNRTGTHIAAIISPTLDHTELMVYNIATKEVERIGARGNDEIYTALWLKGERLLYGVSRGKLGGMSILVGEAGILSNAYTLFPNTGGYIVSVPPADRNRPLFKINPDSEYTGRYSEVVRLSTEHDSGTSCILDRYPALEATTGFDYAYMADKEGRLEYAKKYSDDGYPQLFRVEGEKWIQCPVDLEEIDNVEAGDEPGQIIAVGKRADGKPRPLQVMEAATGKVLDTLLDDPAYDFDGRLFRDPVSHRIVGATYNRSGPYVEWFTDSYRKLQKMLNDKFPGLVVRILDLDDSGKIVLFATSSDRQPVVFNWLNLETKTIGLIKNSAPWIDAKRMRPMSAIKYKTRDGKQLDAYVTLPEGASKSNPAPMIVLPGSDRYQRNTWSFNPTVQFLASRGYAVLQPAFRGNEGYNWMFTLQDEWDYKKMSEDVTDATRAFIKSGYVDKNRVGIMGSAFGGFLALMGATDEPDLYKCVVALSPTYDWGKMISESKSGKYQGPYYTRMTLKLGDPAANSARFDAIAPLRRAGQVRAATFVAHGEFENSANLSQSKDFLSILNRNQVPTESEVYANEPSGALVRVEHRVDYYERVEAFLAKHLQGK